MGREEETYSKPVDDMGVGRVSSATGVLLITRGLDHNGVIEGS